MSMNFTEQEVADTRKFFKSLTSSPARKRMKDHIAQLSGAKGWNDQDSCWHWTGPTDEQQRCYMLSDDGKKIWIPVLVLMLDGRAS